MYYMILKIIIPIQLLRVHYYIDINYIQFMYTVFDPDCKIKISVKFF